MKTLEDDNIMPFGKYRGRRLEDVPDSYIRWLWEEGNIKESINDDTEKGALARYCRLAYSSMTK